METTTTPAVAAPAYATREAYMAVLTEAGITFDDQSGFIKVLLPGGRLYVANTKTVRRVDLAEFEFALGRLTTPPSKPNGKVLQQMILGRGEATDLANFKEVLTHLQSLPAIEKAKPAPKVKAPKADKAATTPAAPAEMTPEDKEARKKLIIKAAEEMGVAVSKKSIAYEPPPSSPEEIAGEEVAVAEALEAAAEAGVLVANAAE